MDIWEVHLDESTDRKFYINTVTKEKTWKPPRLFVGVRDMKDGPAANAQPTSATEHLPSPNFSPAAVQRRVKSGAANCDRLSQTKSMVLTDSSPLKLPVSRHRRNHSQHNLSEIIGMVDQSCLQPLEKNGFLNKAKITDGGKKLRKNWTSSWVCLEGNKIEFYKERKQQTLASLKTGYKAENVDLCGAQIDWAKDKSSRKNVLQLTTVTGNEFLLQSDDDSIHDWYKTIKHVIDKLSKKGGSTSGISIWKSSSSEELNRSEGDNSNKSNPKEPKPEHRKSLILRLNHSSSDTSEKKRVKSRLKKFISRRPSLKTLQEKGLIKDQVFGCHLATLCIREGATVPRFVKLCIEAVEKRGLDADGIYRVSGNLATIQKLRFVVDHEEKLNLDDSQWEDIHVVTGALKMFFRELPEPLFPYSFFDQFVDAIKNQNYTQRVQCMKRLVNKLPKPNHDTLRVLVKHLQKIIAKALVNLMSSQSLGIVFGPTLMWPEKESSNLAVFMIYQNQIIDLILSEHIEIFDHEEK
ncbi:rho GTPase-activating protein 15-like isoform X2 [Scyliorhinus canicula]|uniref:rho GTPase-activating protein 15-like isoform X2 n=1 Tax=Scyliorhinus canicula TaxID=7830 RepID=UPI0018F2A2C1|nr:rho GTPase-activating protein 15-like isoform X2 [Scyliorhinus canicula]